MLMTPLMMKLPMVLLLALFKLMGMLFSPGFWSGFRAWDRSEWLFVRRWNTNHYSLCDHTVLSFWESLQQRGLTSRETISPALPYFPLNLCLWPLNGTRNRMRRSGDKFNDKPQQVFQNVQARWFVPSPIGFTCTSLPSHLSKTGHQVSTLGNNRKYLGSDRDLDLNLGGMHDPTPSA